MSQCGHVAIVGRPNVGKSTLLNYILGQKLCITSRKPQTTRDAIRGIKTEGEVQAIYVDTPGLHRQEKKVLNRVLNRAARQSIDGVDVIVFLVDARAWQSDDQWILEQYLIPTETPVILVLNKIDKLKDKSTLLTDIDRYHNSGHYAAIIPMCAQRGENLNALEAKITEFLPEGDFWYDKEMWTDRSSEFLVAELIREKLTRQLGAELPYALKVEIEKFAPDEKLIHICAAIWVEKESQKGIVIGKKGERLKQVGQAARIEAEKLLEQKIFLELWVKVVDSWGDNEKLLSKLDG